MPCLDEPTSVPRSGGGDPNASKYGYVYGDKNLTLLGGRNEQGKDTKRNYR